MFKPTITQDDIESHNKLTYFCSGTESTGDHSIRGRNSFLNYSITELVELIEFYYTSSNNNKALNIIYVNSTLPQQLNDQINSLKLKNKYNWLNDESMMKSFKYERISDIFDLNHLIKNMSNEVTDLNEGKENMKNDEDITDDLDMKNDNLNQDNISQNKIDIFFIEDLNNIIKNSNDISLNYNKINEKLVESIQLLKFKCNLNSIIIDYIKNWFIELLI